MKILNTYFIANKNRKYNEEEQELPKIIFVYMSWAFKRFCLNKLNGSREAIMAQNDMLFEFDYEAYHPRILGELIGYKFDKKLNWFIACFARGKSGQLRAACFLTGRIF